jgi:pSer/pThr/pTyr-binding forkhead associated (FHA) protein
VIRFEENEYTLVDLDSTNGTYLNQEKVVKSPLVDNDTIRIGRTEMRFKSLY